MTFAPKQMARWRKRKAEVEEAVSRGDMTIYEAQVALKTYAAALLADKPDPPPKPRHLRVVD